MYKQQAALKPAKITNLPALTAKMPFKGATVANVNLSPLILESTN